MIESIPLLIALALCLLFSFLFSGMEAGVFTLNRLRIRRLARIGNAQARLLQGFLEKPEKFLWTILVGNTLVNFLVMAWCVAVLHERLAGRPALLIAVLLAVVFVFYSFFDLLPKMLFRLYPNRFCLSCAWVMRMAGLMLAPVVFAGETVSRLVMRRGGSQPFTGRLFGNREEMRAVMAEAAQALTGEEHAMVNRVLDLQHFTVGRITVPLAKTIAVEAGSKLGHVLATAAGNNLSRLPVWELRDGARRIAGLVDVGPLLFQEAPPLDRTALEFMTPALFLDDNTRLEVALRRMQRAGQRLAVVLGRDGREIGVVSLEDILKLMFGEVKL